MAGAESATADGQYTVSLCKNTAGDAGDDSGWSTVRSSGQIAITNGCSWNSGMSMTFWGSPWAGNEAVIRWTAPTNTKLVSMRLTRQASNIDPGTMAGILSYYMFNQQGSILDSCVYNWGQLVTSSKSVCGSIVDESIGTSATQFVDLQLQCYTFANTNCDPVSSSALPRIVVQRLQATLQDASSPVPSNTNGELASRSTLTGLRSLSFSATDLGSGLFQSRVLVDGTVRQTSPVNSSGSDFAGRCVAKNGTASPRKFDNYQPCALSDTPSVSYNSADVEDGAHQLKVEIEDAAGNRSSVINRSVVVDNDPPLKVSEPTVELQSSTAQVGKALKCKPGSWDGQSPTYTYQWYRGEHGKPAGWTERIVGATENSYTLTDEDAGQYVLCEVTATDAGGSSAPSLSSRDAAPWAGGVSVKARPCETNDSRPSCAKPAPEQRNEAALPTPTPQPIPAASCKDSGGCGSSEPAPARIKLQTDSRVRLAPDESIAISGVLTDARGKSISGATLAVQERGTSAVEARNSVAESDEAGAFTYIARPGPSRSVRIRYGTASNQTEAEVFLSVETAVSLRATRLVRARGRARIRGAVSTPVPSMGVMVEVQGRRQGAARWITFARVRSDHVGRFRASYRFKFARSKQRYQFRATARQQGGYPYLGGKSHPFSVRIR